MRPGSYVLMQSTCCARNGCILVERKQQRLHLPRCRCRIDMAAKQHAALFLVCWWLLSIAAALDLSLPVEHAIGDAAFSPAGQLTGVIQPKVPSATGTSATSTNLYAQGHCLPSKSVQASRSTVHIHRSSLSAAQQEQLRAAANDAGCLSQDLNPALMGFICMGSSLRVFCSVQVLSGAHRQPQRPAPGNVRPCQVPGGRRRAGAPDCSHHSWWRASGHLL